MTQRCIQYLLSLPPRMAAEFAALEQKRAPEWFVTHDPPGCKVGSGGGTAHLLAEAWRHTGLEQPFSHWLRSRRKLIIHGGGQSRRLPAYAPAGKLLMPFPVLRWATGQRLDQSLLDVQLPDYEHVLQHAPPNVVAMIASGDVLLRFSHDLPLMPEVDVIGFGMRVSAERAKDHGVFFSPRQRPTELAFCLQKPSPSAINELSTSYLHWIDTGLWLLSERAVNLLMQRSGWNPGGGGFNGGAAAAYDLYSQFGAALGSEPRQRDAAINNLSTAVIPLPDAEFYHFGTTRQMIESISILQKRELNEQKLGLAGMKRRPDRHVLNSHFEDPVRLSEHHSLWIENSHIPATWTLTHEHALTGVPPNDWLLVLDPGVCLDFVPIAEEAFAVRSYGYADRFSGAVDDPNCLWIGQPAAEWFHARGLTDMLESLRGVDIHQAALFPVMESVDPRFLQWLFTRNPEDRPEFTQLWRAAHRLSADSLSAEANFHRLYASREAYRRVSVPSLLSHFRSSVLFKLDLAATASLVASGQVLPSVELREGDDPLHGVHSEMFLAAVLRHQGQDRWRAHESRAFARLRDIIVQEAQLSPALPRKDVLEDQIVWGRSPVRLDLAGGWSDTPPYCLEYGGRVLNLAVNLNGQPPIQVFARVSPTTHLVVRSIDLGVEQRIRTYEELDTFAQPDSEFALAKAALALAGFLPRFHAASGASSLQEQLQAFGGGIELSMLSAVPKGSGLGTSSILAATLLATLSNLCGLHWDKTTLFSRTLALEQLLTTGGGWQDQAGAIFRGVKLIATGPGLAQVPTVRWLPEHLFERDYANRLILLYYTGITRLAKGILQEIVRGMFLNSPAHLRLTQAIAANADRGFAAVQECDYEALVATVQRSWQLNQHLDAGTNPPEVQAILDRCGSDLAAAKLLGAGGGGFLLMFAKTESAAERIRERLLANPPNERARFVEFEVSATGLQLTRS